MNLYDFHETLIGHTDIYSVITPEIAYELAQRDYYANYGMIDPALSRKLEPIMARSAETAFHYADTLLDGRFPLGEPAIAKDPSIALEYIFNFVQDRWPEAEPALRSNRVIWDYYTDRNNWDHGDYPFDKDRS